jgi:ABC-type branched-subunit amino acid transport system substrate-binding protein
VSTNQPSGYHYRATLTAALTLSLTGRYRRQGNEAAAGIRLWADAESVQLTLVDDGGVAEAAIKAYTSLLGKVDLLIGPYSSGLVRAIAPHLRRVGGQLLWNHGGSADDLARPGIVSLAAPASSYLHSVLDEAFRRRIARILIVKGAGRFARAVADGAVAYAVKRDLSAQTISMDDIPDHAFAGLAVLVAGDFDHDLGVIERLHRLAPPRRPPLLAAVAAGIQAFGQEAGAAAEGVLGPAQWWPTEQKPEIGPSGTAFANWYRRQHGSEPSYVAAQAAAAGYLAQAAYGLGLTPDDVPRWRTSTLLGDFALDPDWRQTGHRITTVQWRNGEMQRLRSGRAEAPQESRTRGSR